MPLTVPPRQVLDDVRLGQHAATLQQARAPVNRVKRSSLHELR